MAREARIREQESRDALARAREVLEPEHATRLPTPAPAPTATAWQQRPLAKTVPIPSAPTAPSANERALAAELREARATLAIARETTRQQREELTRLRDSVALFETDAHTRKVETEAEAADLLIERTLFAGPDASAALAERARLEDRVLVLERSLAEEALVRHQLESAIASRDQILSERAERLAHLAERLEVQDRALDEARRMADQERRRHTEAQSVLARLRAALGGSEAEVASENPIRIALAGPAGVAVPTPSPAASPTGLPDAEPAASNSASAAAAPAGTLPSTTTTTRRHVRAPIFEYWREDQIRRHFGPLGIDGLADLLRDPLTRRMHARSTPLPILLLGHGAARAARPLAEQLLRSGAPAFALHVADADGESFARIGEAEPLRDVLQSEPCPKQPGQLADVLRAIIPAVIVCRDFLTWQADTRAWIETLGAVGDAGSCLLFLEEAGLGPVAASPELRVVGERIFALLPDRYTRAPNDGASIERFEEAFAGREAGAPNRLLAHLRGRFNLELFAQFGLLAEAFVSGPIAPCFDAEAARDQRFLRQIADVDDRRQESGEDTPFHMIARIDPAAGAR